MPGETVIDFGDTTPAEEIVIVVVPPLGAGEGAGVGDGEGAGAGEGEGAVGELPPPPPPKVPIFNLLTALPGNTVEVPVETVPPFIQAAHAPN